MQNQLEGRGGGGGLGLSLLCAKETTPVASGPDWLSGVPVARQPSSGVPGLADRQLLMKPGQRVGGSYPTSFLMPHTSRDPATHRYMIYTHTHTLTDAHMHVYTHLFIVFEAPSRRGQSPLLECNHVLDSPPPHHHSPHHPVTNIYTAKEGTACVITTHAGKVSACKVSLSLRYVPGFRKKKPRTPRCKDTDGIHAKHDNRG